jgi:hypothetical protein
VIRLGLSLEEFESACRACEWVRVPEERSAVFRSFLLGLLAERESALARKLGRLDEEAFSLLCALLRKHQDRILSSGLRESDENPETSVPVARPHGRTSTQGRKGPSPV